MAINPLEQRKIVCGAVTWRKCRHAGKEYEETSEHLMASSVQWGSWYTTQRWLQRDPSWSYWTVDRTQTYVTTQENVCENYDCGLARRNWDLRIPHVQLEFCILHPPPLSSPYSPALSDFRAASGWINQLPVVWNTWTPRIAPMVDITRRPSPNGDHLKASYLQKKRWGDEFYENNAKEMEHNSSIILRWWSHIKIHFSFAKWLLSRPLFLVRS